MLTNQYNPEGHADRVRKMTLKSVNRKLDRETESVIRDVSAMGPEAINVRLAELDKEWDIDRALMLNFSVVVFAQLLAARKNKKWLWGPLIQAPFLFLHATVGWCPPASVLRPLGFRTRKEINAEREALLGILQRERVLH